MATSKIKNPLNPISLRVVINEAGTTGNLQAFKIGRLVFVTGLIHPITTGVDLVLARIYGVKVINNNMKAQIGGYNNTSQEVNFFQNGNNTDLRVNTTLMNEDLKVNACFICE